MSPPEKPASTKKAAIPKNPSQAQPAGSGQSVSQAERSTAAKKKSPATKKLAPPTKPQPLAKTPLLAKSQYEALSEFRYQLRRFLNFSERAARAAGLTPLQYQLLLHVRGFPGRDWASVGELAERLQMQQHGVVALLTRCEQHKLIQRRSNATDGRLVEIHLLPAGARQLERLAALHEAELRSLQGTFRVAQITAFNDQDLTP
jgi:DNA-binding MarR family transcriptional regulator